MTKTGTTGRQPIILDTPADIRWRFEIPPSPIPEKDIRDTFTTDIIVVGAGTSGLTAALSATQSGAGVIVLDRHTIFRWGGGHNSAIDSRIQKKLGIRVDKDEVCLQLMKYAGNRPDQRLLRLWADNSGPILDWLMDMTEAAGVETYMYQWPQPPAYDAKREYYPEFPTCHWFTGEDEELNQYSLLSCLEDNVKKAGVAIHYRTRAEQLVCRSNGRVTGVIARGPGDHYIRYNARKAVLLCTGDYGNNPVMMQRYCPGSAEVARTHNIYMSANENLMAAPSPINTGDGHQMAMWIGAIMDPGPPAPMSHASAGPLGADAFLHVNIFGERYENEDIPGQNIANSLERQPEKKCWQIFDSKWPEELPRMGVGLLKHYSTDDFRLRDVEKDSFKADSIEALARKIDVPPDTLKATVERYNHLARLVNDLDFGKRPDRLTAIDKPPYYAGASERQFLVVLGGLNTNAKLQPLDADNHVIPGLYLAGNTVGNRFAIDYPTMCPGLSHGMAWTTGRLAGLYAAAE